VIGAGIIGISTALKLQAEGRQACTRSKGVAAGKKKTNQQKVTHRGIRFCDDYYTCHAWLVLCRKAPKMASLIPLRLYHFAQHYALKITFLDVPVLFILRASWKDKYQAALTATSIIDAYRKPRWTFK